MYMYCVYSIVQYTYNVYAEHYRQSIESGEVKNRGIEIVRMSGRAFVV